MSNNDDIHFRAVVTIDEVKKEEYKKLIQDMSRAVEANEPGTIALLNLEVESPAFFMPF
jgi:hypothetical protein